MNYADDVTIMVMTGTARQLKIMAMAAHKIEALLVTDRRAFVAQLLVEKNRYLGAKASATWVYSWTTRCALRST